MLVLTHNATDAIRLLVTDKQAAPGAGLRIVAERDLGGKLSFEMDVFDAPGVVDEVLEEGGARVFLNPPAAELLEKQVLDARIEDNRVKFALSPQNGG